MARKVSTPTAPTAPARLRIPQNEARERLLSRREAGASLLSAQQGSIRTKDDLKDAESAFRRWSDFNKELLRRIFDSEEYANSYTRVGTSYILGLQQDLNREIRDHLEEFKAKVEYLESLAERVDLIDVLPGVTASEVKVEYHQNKSKSNKKVFLVHGRDEETKSIVARFLENCGLEPIILHEQADQGRTIIEKFEQSSDVSFAVVLLTPDDIGGIRASAGGSEGNPQPRPRQNVILELGYFIGKLGRQGVCALKSGDMELPSDFSGVIYTPYSGADEGWKIKLAREMRAAGLDVDLNRALG